MQSTRVKHICALALGALIAVNMPLVAQEKAEKTKTHDHKHSHDHNDEDIYKGLFNDDQIKPRELSDWAGDWQSVYPLLRDGSLDEVMRHKAENGDKTFDEYKAYYTTGYETDVNRILFEGDTATFFRATGPVQGQYENDGYEVLTYDSGSRGVRYVFKKVAGDADAPAFFQFSDHRIAPAISDHYHLYWGDDRTALLSELTNWPTYYPADLSPDQIVEQMH
ncbi:hypothetical protein GCM10008927_25840 [Amylibacter ulvae]|uniref:ZinT domain-containing protein n=1 Tax=Paramylibacter ulvae TaxID=1651968 RepID=A0ABQ3D7U5_9RHOB|nr:ZinT/AdcA family metal-binding protein [Amylibacter ulvae]GHA58993.1 hypothetical protein GCM10008927_25840 [Amylibacter ulvae]